MSLSFGAGIRIAVLALLAGYADGSVAAAEAPYDYPIADALEATVLGTPAEYRAPLPARVPTEELRLEIFPGRKPPAAFWYADRLPLLVMRQRHAAPLVFVVGGTGSSHSGAGVQGLARALYGGGFHVATLPSPTHPSFIAAASQTQVPGLPAEDARDLYRAMRRAHAAIAGSIDIAGVHLVGYSLGAAQAAHVARLDDAEQGLGFGRVLLINPPVNAYRSAERLDRMIDAIPGGIDGFDRFFEQHFRQFAAVYRQADTLDFNNDFLYALYKHQPPSARTFEALIGISFRLAAANMLFTADVLTHAGVVVPRERSIASTDSLTDYVKVSAYLGFAQYVENLLLPAVRRHRPRVSLAGLVEESSLAAIEGYLRGAAKIGLMHNLDDPILGEGDLDFLRRAFAGRARLYPKGGHLGNLDHHRNVADMIAFLTGGWGRP